jgi:hypothetical protein
MTNFTKNELVDLLDDIADALDDHDVETARQLLGLEGTHTIMMEKNRLELFRAVQAFLDEAGGL